MVRININTLSTSPDEVEGVEYNIITPYRNRISRKVMAINTVRVAMEIKNIILNTPVSYFKCIK
jgi:hypothetical protein